jgi:hypothetical protein
MIPAHLHWHERMGFGISGIRISDTLDFGYAG